MPATPGRLSLSSRVTDKAVSVTSSALNTPATETFIGLNDRKFRPGARSPTTLLTSPVCFDSEASVRSLPAPSARFVAVGTAMSASACTASEKVSDVLPSTIT